MFKYLWNIMFIIIILSLSLPHIPRSAFSFFSLPFLPPFPLPFSSLSPFFSSLFLSFPFSLFLPLFLFPFLFSFSLLPSLFSSFPFFLSFPPFSPSRFLLSFPIFGVRGGSLPPPAPHWLRPCVSPRRLSESLILFGSAMFCSTFNLVTTCRTAVRFETLKDGSLQMNSLALNNCFSYRNVFQNGVNTLSKRFKKPGFFWSKNSSFV